MKADDNMMKQLTEIAPELSIFEASKIAGLVKRSKSPTAKGLKNDLITAKETIRELQLDNDAVQFSLHLTEQNEESLALELRVTEEVLNECAVANSLMEEQNTNMERWITHRITEEQNSGFRPLPENMELEINDALFDRDMRMKVAANNGDGKAFAVLSNEELDSAMDELRAIQPDFFETDTVRMQIRRPVQLKPVN